MIDLIIESPFYQGILDKGRQKGFQMGLEQGRKEEAQRFLFKQLNRKFGELDKIIEQNIADISLEQSENLAEMIFDFQTVEDVSQWLESNNTKRKDEKPSSAMGVFQLRNVINEKIYVEATMDFDQSLREIVFELCAKIHPSESLIADWNEFGIENFAFEILEEISPPQNSDIEITLIMLKDLWLEKCEPYDEKGYNKRGIAVKEILRAIVDNVKSQKLF